MPSVIKVDQIQSDTGNVAISGNVSSTLRVSNTGFPLIVRSGGTNHITMFDTRSSTGVGTMIGANQNGFTYYDSNYNGTATAGGHIWRSNSNDILTLGATGLFTTTAGIRFPATQVSDADPNTLDDYEEGAWTPTISGSSSGTVTTGTRYGSYTKIGRMVYASFHIINPSLTSIGGIWRLSNLPFTSTSTYMSSGKVAWKRYIPVISNGTEMTFYMVGGTAVAQIGWGRNTTDESDYITGGSVAADTLFEGFLIYQANA